MNAGNTASTYVAAQINECWKNPVPQPVFDEETEIAASKSEQPDSDTVTALPAYRSYNLAKRKEVKRFGNFVCSCGHNW